MSNQSIPPPMDAFPPPPPPPPAMMPAGLPIGPMPPYPPPPRRRSRLAIVVIVLLVLLLGGSVLVNLGMIVTLGGAAGPLQQEVLRDGSRSQVVAVYELAGIIDERMVNEFNAFARQAIGDSNVQAVVLRVESPGGGVSASDEIHNRVLDLKKAGKKVVVSMGSVAASGGYYVSAPADRILAEATTVTGSIGVISMYPVLSGTLEKVGAKMVVIKSTPAVYKDVMSPFREPQPQDEAYIRDLLDKIHQRFVDVIYDGGKAQFKAVEDVKALAIGKIWLGPEAMDLHLVDQIGYLTDAEDQAASLAGLSSPKVVRYARRAGLLQLLASERSPGVNIDAHLLDDIQTPRLMLLWKVE